MLHNKSVLIKSFSNCLDWPLKIDSLSKHLKNAHWAILGLKLLLLCLAVSDGLFVKANSESVCGDGSEHCVQKDSESS